MARRAVEVIGVRELNRALRALPEDIRRNALNEIADAGAAVVEEEARRRAPRGRTGKLADSINRSPDPTSSTPGNYVVGPSAGVMASRKEGFYGLFLEKGTRDRVRKNGGRTGRVRALHWLRKSLEGSRKRVSQAMEVEARKQVALSARRVR